MNPEPKLPARIDDSLPLMYSTPLPMPGPLAERLVGRIQKLKTMLKGFPMALDILNEMQNALCASQPEPVKPLAKGTIEDIKAFCLTLGLPASDGEWFFWKCEGCGWMNGTSKIKDWPATIRAWKIIGCMPSQKPQREGYGSVMGNPMTASKPSLAENQLNKIARKVRGEK